MTPNQLTTLKAAILADPSLIALAADFETGAIAAYLSKDSTFVVWRNTTPTADIYDAIVWANLTPTDTPDGTQLWLNRTQLCQSKQLNLQILLQGRDQVNSAKANIRTGLQDALTNLPSAAGGGITGAGWPVVKPILTRAANKLEQIFATGTGTVATPGNLVFEGGASNDLIVEALRS